ncbi:hypothetical protein [Paenibacillus eucommiae]|uniref:WG repeat-containing protein n=1 Tax=Paenibacillus eucommiae TaxID=1355755 RepID=A0ABS4INT8_9BACL|nr:hypothetical protein [Paenibacillus eucommiae]MBP1989220.1 hypothetical protein [Paenibacillus eucommiae]
MNLGVRLGGLAGLILVAACITAYFVVSHEEKPELEAPPLVISTVQPEATPDYRELAEANLQVRMNEINSWKQADRLFSTDSIEPITLVQGNREVVYLQGNQLLYEKVGETNYPSIPIVFPTKRDGYVWRSGQVAYIGFPIGPDEESSKGEWYEINLASENPNPLKRLGELPLSPARVAAMSISEEPAAAAVLVNNNGTYAEFMIDSTGKGPLLINDYSPYKSMEATDRWIASTRDAGTLSFDKVTKLNVTGTNLFVMEDAEGLLIYQNNSSYAGAYRFSGFKLEQSKVLSTDHAQAAGYRSGAASDAHVLLRVNNHAGARNMVLLTSNQAFIMEDQPKLLEEGWEVFNGLSFVKAADGLIDTISFSSEDAVSPLQDHVISLSVGAITDLNRKGSMWEGVQDGARVFLSHYDLINNRMKDPQPLWMKQLLPGETASEAQPLPVTMEISLPLTLLDLHAEQVKQGQAPEALLAELGKRNGNSNSNGKGSEDLASRNKLRKFGEAWYILTVDRLEQWDKAGFKELGQLPVSAHTSTGNDVKITAAQDYILQDGFWYVADTFGNRILKLNEKLDIVGETYVTVPSGIMDLGRGEIEVKGLHGTMRFTSELKLKTSLQAEAVPIQQSPMQKVTLLADSYFKQSPSIEWTLFEDRLYIVDSEKKTLISHFIGPMSNLYGHPKLILYENQVLVVLDDRIHVFNSSGQWQRQILFPRTRPDAIYATTVTGENSYVLDEEQGRLYLIQGYNVLQIDLASGEVSLLFRQLQTNLGKLLLDRGVLYFTLYTNNGYGAADTYNELVACRTSTGTCGRTLIPAGFTTEQIREDHVIVLRSLFDSVNTNDKQSASTYMTYKLNEEGSPE